MFLENNIEKDRSGPSMDRLRYRIELTACVNKIFIFCSISPFSVVWYQPLHEKKIRTKLYIYIHIIYGYQLESELSFLLRLDIRNGLKIN